MLVGVSVVQISFSFNMTKSTYNGTRVRYALLAVDWWGGGGEDKI